MSNKLINKLTQLLLLYKLYALSGALIISYFI